MRSALRLSESKAAFVKLATTGCMISIPYDHTHQDELEAFPDTVPSSQTTADSPDGTRSLFVM